MSIRQTGVEALDLVNRIVKSSASGLPGPVRLGVQLGTFGVSKSLKYAKNQLEKSSNESAQFFLNTGLKDIPELAIRELNTLSQEHPEDARQLAQDFIHRYKHIFLGNQARSTEEITILNDTLLEALSGWMAHRQSTQGITNNEFLDTTEIIENHIRPILLIHKTLAQLVDHQQTQLQQSQMKTQEAISRIESIEKTLPTNLDSMDFSSLEMQTAQKKFQFLQDSIFGRQPTFEQLKYLKQKLLEANKTDSRYKIMDQIRLVESRVFLERNVGEVLDQTQTLLKLAATFGVDPNVIAKIQSVAETIGRLTNGLSQFIQNPRILGATKSLLSIFGSTIDPHEERHKEVLSGLNILSQGQLIIQRNQEHLFSNQKEILNLELLNSQKLDRVLANQEIFYHSIKSSAQRLDARSEEIRERLSLMSEISVNTNRKTSAVLTKKLFQCEAFFDETLMETYPNYDRSTHTFTTLSSLQQHGSEHSKDLAACLSELRYILKIPSYSRLTLFSDNYLSDITSLNQGKYFRILANYFTS